MLKRLAWIMLILPLPAVAAEKRDFYSCTQDSECGVVKDYCGAWTAVNNDKAKEANTYFKAVGDVIKCVPIPHMDKPGASCKDSQCVINPKKK